MLATLGLTLQRSAVAQSFMVCAVEATAPPLAPANPPPDSPPRERSKRIRGALYPDNRYRARTARRKQISGEWSCGRSNGGEGIGQLATESRRELAAVRKTGGVDPLWINCQARFEIADQLPDESDIINGAIASSLSLIPMAIYAVRGHNNKTFFIGLGTELRHREEMCP